MRDREVLLRRLWRAVTKPVRIETYEHSVKVGAAYVIGAIDFVIGAFLHDIWGWWMVACISVGLLLSAVLVGVYASWKVARGDWETDGA